MMENTPDYYTYSLNRVCKHCQAPIPDQAYSGRIFCPTEYPPDGTVKSCKDDYHSALRREEMEPFTAMALFYRNTHRAILELLDEKGELVSKNTIDTKGIQLHRNLKVEKHGEELRTFYFHKYAFEQLSKDLFKIKQHGLF